MPYSHSIFKNEFKSHLKKILPFGSKVLDVGPGSGTYSDLFIDCDYEMDCVEIWEPYIGEFNLHSKYRNVYVSNVLDFDISNHDYIILGDVLEHINVLDAQNLIRKINSMNKYCMVAVPYLYSQGEYEGNIYEEHKQSDLTREIMEERFPELYLLYGDNSYGYYVNYRTLTTIANHNKTDKGTVYFEAHSYTDIYSDFINSNCSNCSLLEIGFWKGDSIRMWNQYNPNMTIFAIDNDPNVVDFLKETDKVNLYIGDQSDHELLNRIIKSTDLDFVVDDGSHNYLDILNSFSFIFPRMKMGSIYFIEDLHAPHAQYHKLTGGILNVLHNCKFSKKNIQMFCNNKLMIITKI